MRGPNCADCLANVERKAWNSPPCHHRPCEASELMLPDLGAWIDFYYHLNNRLVKESGAARDAMSAAGVWDTEEIDILCQMEVLKAQKELADREAEDARRNKEL